jgi:DNA polymerase-1
MKELIIVDGNSLLYRAYYATAAMGNLMVNKDGIPTNAVYGFANMLENVIKMDPEYLVVAFDYGKKTFRNDLFEVYKGTRSKTPDELTAQFSMIREYLTAHGIKYEEIEGYEGDDIIGTLSNQAQNEGFKVDILTSDKDMLQLITKDINVWLTKKGVGDLQIMDEKAFKDTYGLVPDRMRDIKGLMGDSADNIPGVPGVGEKTALKLLHQYDTIENLMEHSDELKGKLKEKIETYKDQGLLSKRIATIIKDVPLEVNIEDYHYDSYDYDELSQFYRRYGMNSLLKKMAMNDTTHKKVEVSFKEVDALPIVRRDSALVVGVFDTNYHKSPIIGFGIYNEEEAYYISIENALQSNNFKTFIEDENINKYGYDIKKCINSARWHGLNINGFTFDLQLASYILNPSLKNEIKTVCEYYQYYDVLYDEEVYGKGAKKHIPDSKLLGEHLVKQAKAIYELKDKVIEKLKVESQFDLYSNIEMKIAIILADMEFTGAKVDRNVLVELETTFQARIDELTKKIYEYAGEEFNISSPKQLGTVLFENMGLPNGKKTKTGYSTSVDVLEKLKPIHPIIEAILEYRTLTKLQATYVTGLQAQIFDDGKIHTMYNQALTQTGRLSSTDPNLQNIPVKTPEGKLIRKAFIPSFDYLVSYDYSQIELRVLAHLANETSLIKAFDEGKDIHAHTASVIFHVPEDEVTPLMRRNAKVVNFGIIYGMSDFGLASQINVSVSEAKEFIRTYFEKYPGIKTYMDSQIKKAEEKGYVSTILNRKRYIPEIKEKNHLRKELGKRLAMNSPIQGSAADILKVAMIKVDKLFKQKGLKSKMILQVHDELIFDVYENELEEVKNTAKLAMETAIKLNVSLKAEGTHAKNWYDLK